MCPCCDYYDSQGGGCGCTMGTFEEMDDECDCTPDGCDGYCDCGGAMDAQGD